MLLELLVVGLLPCFATTATTATTAGWVAVAVVAVVVVVGGGVADCRCPTTTVAAILQVVTTITYSVRCSVCSASAFSNNGLPLIVDHFVQLSALRLTE